MPPKRVKNKNEGGYFQLKRQKSEADDAGERKRSEFTPESYPSKRCSKIPPTSVRTALFAFSKTNCRTKTSAYLNRRIQNGVDKMSSKNDRSYGMNRVTDGSSYNSQSNFFTEDDNCLSKRAYDSGVHCKSYKKDSSCKTWNPSRPEHLKSAGANIGTFQINCPVSAWLNNGHSAVTDVGSKNVRKLSRNESHELDFADQAESRTSFRFSQQSNTSSTSKSDLETDDIDMDIIVPVDGQTDFTKSTDIPDQIPPAYFRVPLKKSGGSRCFPGIIERGNKTSAVYIPHPLATDDPELGDRFGASIQTSDKRKDGFYRHIIKQVDINGVADKMKICDDDELALINNNFVPDMDHEEVLDLFRHVPVDSHTRLKLVLRRTLANGKWEWVTTSAILIPELPNEPRVRELKFKMDDDGSKIYIHWYKLQIPGTNLFVIILDGQLGVEVSKNSHLHQYSICVMVRATFESSTGSWIREACVFGVHHEDKNKNCYFSVQSSGDVCLNECPQWFGYGRRGSQLSLEVKALNEFIGYQLENYGTKGILRTVTEQERSWFDCNTIEGSYDHPDAESGRLSGASSLTSSMTSSISSRNSSQPSSLSSEPLSLRLSDASVSSYGSASSGSHGDSGYYRPSRSSRVAYEEPMSDSGSEFLSCDGTYLSCGTPNTPMANLNLFPTYSESA